jgi:amino acid transporter
VTSRIIYALARDDALPLSWAIKPVYPGTQCPVRSVLVVFLLDSLFMLLPLVNSSALAAITGTCTVGYQVPPR